MTLAEYLREHTRLTGTKLSCAQGGCGACNVMLTTFKDGKPQFASVNACLRPILSLDGCGGEGFLRFFRFLVASIT
jgi:xanthine dehydrogenase/oxidase